MEIIEQGLNDDNQKVNPLPATLIHKPLTLNFRPESINQHLRSLVEIIEQGLNDDNQKVNPEPATLIHKP